MIGSVCVFEKIEIFFLLTDPVSIVSRHTVSHELTINRKRKNTSNSCQEEDPDPDPDPEDRDGDL